MTSEAWADQTPGCQLARVASLPVVMKHNRILVGGALNGQEVRFQIDTGAQYTILFKSAAAALDLSQFDIVGKHIYAIGGEVAVREALVETLTLGKWSAHDWRATVAGDSPMWVAEKIAGLLGEDFFHNFDVEFDLAHQVINLYQANHCDEASLGFWPGNIVVAEISRGGINRSVIEVMPEINGSRMRALVDSGADVTLLATSAASRVGVSPDSPGVETAAAGRGVGAKSVAAWIGTFDSFRLGDETIRNARLRFADFSKDAKTERTGSRIAEEMIPYDLLLGADFLASHHVLISHSQGKMYFSHNGGPVFQTD